MARTRAGSQQRNRTRGRLLTAMRELDNAWVGAFHRAGLGHIYFSRLFTESWLGGTDAVTKAEAYARVEGVSTQTAMKYVKRAIDEGYVEEARNPADGRSRLLRMSVRLRLKFTQVIDRANEAFTVAIAGRPAR